MHLALYNFSILYSVVRHRCKLSENNTNTAPSIQSRSIRSKTKRCCATLEPIVKAFRVCRTSFKYFVLRKRKIGRNLIMITGSSTAHGPLNHDRQPWPVKDSLWSLYKKNVIVRRSSRQDRLSDNYLSYSGKICAF